MTQRESFAVENVGEASNLVFRIRQKRLERRHERLHHVDARVTRRVEDVSVVEDHATTFGVAIGQNENVAEINLNINESISN